MKDYIIRKLEILEGQKKVSKEEFQTTFDLATQAIKDNSGDGTFSNKVYSLIASIRKKSEDKSSTKNFEEVKAPKGKVEENEYIDNADKNQFNWGGVRSGSSLFEHPMKPSPMFFRRDGMVFDAVNMYQNSSVFLICNGPSFNDVNHDSLRLPGILTMGINNGAHAFRPNLWTCVDDPSRFMRSIWEDPKIAKFVPQAHFEKKLFDKANGFNDKLVGECPNVIGYRRNERFREDRWLHENTINWGNHKDYGGGRSVMVGALKLCYLLGFKRIYLVGCDFNMTQENGYFFEEKRTKGAVNNNMNSYERMDEYFTKLRPKLEEEGVRVFNLNSKSKLKAFEYMNFSVGVDMEKIDVSDSTMGMYESPKDKKLKDAK